jgi:hypothetical protein
MEIFLDDFTIFSDMSTHLKKIRIFFLKCKEYGINLNPKKCAFMVCSGTILGFIVSKEAKTHDFKKIKTLIQMQVPKTLEEIQVFNGMIQFYKCFIKKIVFIMAPITKLFKEAEMFEWTVTCQTTWGDIKNRYIQVAIFINPN